MQNHVNIIKCTLIRFTITCAGFLIDETMANFFIGAFLPAPSISFFSVLATVIYQTFEIFQTFIS